jgi:hypothetical protein
MLSRSIAIITCLSLVGVSLVPASLVPCCCKTRSVAQSVASLPACPKCPVTIPAAANAAPAPCCAAAPSDSPACCAKVDLKQNCPRCRCLDQLQIVALTQASWDQLSVRVLPAVEIGEVAGVDNPASDSFHIPNAEDPPGKIGFLTTCTLRC